MIIKGKETLMDGLKQPVGELSPAVYWRRRIVAFAGTVLVLVVAYFLVVSPLTGSDDTKTGATESPAATVTNSAASSACWAICAAWLAALRCCACSLNRVESKVGRPAKSEASPAG